MNKVILIGNLTDAPKLTTTPSGINVATFRLAVGRNYIPKDGERLTDFFSCVAWRQCGESIAKHCLKGNRICVWGELQNHEYTDKQGAKRVETQIIIDGWEFCGAKKTEEPKPEPQFTPVEDDDSLPF